MKKKLMQAVVISVVFMPTLVLATPGIMKLFIAVYPQVEGDQLASCRTCHMPIQTDCLNSYGISLRENSLDFSAVEEKDADGDGVSNIAEIKAGELPGSQARADEVFVFTNRIGAITFDHEKHSLSKEYLSVGDCSNCHGTGEESFPRKFDDTVSWQPVAHPLCKGCHKESGSDNAPQRCFDCHDRDRRE